MERDAFTLMANAERDHWWFRGRRYFISRLLDSLGLTSGTTILDAGCGSGGNVPLLQRYGTVWGFEYDHEARERAKLVAGAKVAFGALPEPIPFAPQTFDLIGLFDVLEHVEQPVEALRSLRGRAKPGGYLLITVPALPILWGPHDIAHQHYRRYSLSLLTEQLAEAGWRTRYLSYFNTVLLPLAILQRLRERVFGYSPDQLMLSPRVNSLLYHAWTLERFFIPRGRLPVGMSLIALAQTPDGV